MKPQPAQNSNGFVDASLRKTKLGNHEIKADRLPILGDGLGVVHESMKQVNFYLRNLSCQR